MATTDFRRLVAGLSLIVAITALAIYATPGVSPVAPQKSSEAITSTWGSILAAGGVLSIVVIAIGTDLAWSILVVLLPPVLVFILDFVAIVLPARPVMGFVLAAIPILHAYGLYTNGAAALQAVENHEDMRCWHPWRRKAVLRLRTLLRRPRVAPVIRWLAKRESRWWWDLTDTLVGQALAILIGIVCAVQLGLIDARPKVHADAATLVWFAIGAALTLIAAPAFAVLALRAKALDRPSAPSA